MRKEQVMERTPDCSRHKMQGRFPKEPPRVPPSKQTGEMCPKAARKKRGSQLPALANPAEFSMRLLARRELTVRIEMGSCQRGLGTA